MSISGFNKPFFDHLQSAPRLASKHAHHTANATSFVPADSLECRSGLTLGGPKYSAFEIESGRPILPDAASRIDAPIGGAPELESRAGL
jgi:hypothetical protein